MRRIFLLYCVVNSAFATDVYFAQSSAGSNDGTTCANAYAATRFNTADSNWTAGNTLHLCGTWTSVPATRGSGSAGSPITILFESGAKLSNSTQPATGAMQINHDYIVVDGGTNGVIEATDNGTSLGNQTASEGVHVGESNAPHDVEIKRLTIQNLCVHVNNAANTTCQGSGIKMLHGGGNILIHDNTMRDVSQGINAQFVTSSSGNLIYANTIYNRDAGIIFAPCGNGINVTGSAIYGNDIGDAMNWDDAADYWHHDGVHVFNCGGTTGTVTGLQIYNNYFHGDLGIHSTSHVFLESGGTGPLVFNNVFNNSSPTHVPSNGYVALKNGGIGVSAIVANNTFDVQGNILSDIDGSYGATLKNNLISDPGYCIYLPDAGSPSVDYNLYWQCTAWATGTFYYTLANWRSATGLDANSVMGDPKLTVTDHPGVGSSAIGAGANLTSLGITALNSDRTGVARPSSGAWDIGAYQYVPPVTGSVMFGTFRGTAK